MTDEQFDKLCDFLEELVGENWNAFYNAKDDKLTICFHHEEVDDESRKGKKNEDVF